MKVGELISLLQKHHPDAEVEIYFHPFYATGWVGETEYELWSIKGVGDWGQLGSPDDLVTINAKKLVGA